MAGLLARKGVEDILILSAKGRSFPCFLTPPGAYVFEEGDHYVFSIEISGPSGYWSQIVRPMCLGRPAAGYQRLFEAGRLALEAGAACLVPGAHAGDVARAVADEVRKAGMETGLWCGHGMGMDLGDGVGLSEDNPLELREGAVITIHPHVMLPDREEGLLMGDTFVVRKGGGQNLSRTACELKRLVSRIAEGCRIGRPPEGIACYPPGTAGARTIAAPSSPRGLRRVGTLVRNRNSERGVHSLRPTWFRLHPNLIAIVFSKQRGKRSLIPPCARPSVPGVSARLLGFSTPAGIKLLSLPAHTRIR